MTSFRPRRRLLRLAAVVAALSLLQSPPAVAADDGDGAWAAIRAGGAVLLMRHATAPGVGDPAGFRVDDCGTQRNLSTAGRAEAKAIGVALRAGGLSAAQVWSSEWCRCLETAELLELGPVRRLPLLNSFFARREDAAAQTAELKAWIERQPADGSTLVLVTHQVNISAVTGLFPGSGETVVARREAGGALRVIGTLPPPQP